jgi:hypothetical protein
MDRRTRRASLRAAFCTAACLLAAPATAQGGWTDLDNWNLTETTSTLGGGTQFTISSGGSGSASYRWLDTPSKTTVISANHCTDGTLRGAATIPVNNTSYHALFSGAVGACFILRGRTAIGSGSMVNHDGRIDR